MEIQPVIQGGSLGEDRASLSTGSVSQDEFLKLLIVQLQNQDPLNPLESQEFLAQLATFNSLNQLIGINGKLDAMRSEQLLLSRLEATSLIGKRVSAEGNSVSLSEGRETEVHYTLVADTSRVVVNIMDSRGSLVRVMEVAGQSMGEQTVVWDGEDSAGNLLDPGVYTFKVEAFDLSGKKVGVARLIHGVVTGIDLAGSVPLLEIGNLKIPVTAILRVEENAQTTNSE